MESNIKLKLYLPSIGIDQMSSLIPLLGQAGVNANLFKKAFKGLIDNLKVTKLIIFPVHVFISKNSDFVVKLYDPTISFLIRLVSINNQITLKQIFKIAVFRSKKINNLKSKVKVILGTLASMHDYNLIK